MNQDYKFLLCEVKKTAMDSFEKFINRLSLDIDLFDHLHDIKYSIGITSNENVFAEYYYDENEMIISEKRVKIGLRKVRNDEITYEELVENIAVSYLHEMLHANRAIILANLLNNRNYDESSYKENYNYEYREELKKYREALINILSKYDINNFVGSIPIIVKFNQNKTYSIVAYNVKDFNFEIYNEQFFNSKLINVDSFLYSISKELLDKSKHPINKVIYDYFDYDEVIAVPCDFYYYDKNIRLDVNNIKQFKRFEKKIKSKIALEEIITETLAVIMVFTRDDDFIDFNDLNSCAFDETVYVGLKIIKRLDYDTLRWFLLSSYDEVYYDKFHKIFEEKYNDLLKMMYKLYELEIPYTKDMEKDLNFILRSKLNSKSK